MPAARSRNGQRTTRIPDARLAEMGREREALKDQIAALSTKVAEIDGAVLSELGRRKTRVLEANGVRLTYVQQTSEVVDWDALKPQLDRSQRRLCTKTVFDRKGLAAAVAEGLIDVALVSEFSETKSNKPYLSVSEVNNA